MHSTIRLTAKQIDALRTALVMETANGNRHNHYSDGSVYRALEAKGLVTSWKGSGMTYRGGGSTKRYYQLTPAGRAACRRTVPTRS